MSQLVKVVSADTFSLISATVHSAHGGIKAQGLSRGGGGGGGGGFKITELP